MNTPIKDNFFERMEALGLALTFDDVRLKSGYSEIDPNNVSVKSLFSKNISLKIPLVSAAMDTVTETRMAIEMAKLGGLGIIHRGIDPETQARAVEKVKIHLNGLVERPITVTPDQTIEQIKNKSEEKNYNFQSFPVLDSKDKLVGIITKNDFEMNSNIHSKIKKIMTAREHMTTAPLGTLFAKFISIFIISDNFKHNISPAPCECSNWSKLFSFFISSKNFLEYGKPGPLSLIAISTQSPFVDKCICGGVSCPLPCSIEFLRIFEQSIQK